MVMPACLIVAVGNYAPVITSTPVASVNEDSPYTYTLQGRDYEGTALTKSIVVKPSWLTFNTTTGVLSGTPVNANVGDTRLPCGSLMAQPMLIRFLPLR